VIPIRKNGVVWGELDIDSPQLSRFTEFDRIGLEQFVAILENALFS
jgi:GAF domain-containing protein